MHCKHAHNWQLLDLNVSRMILCKTYQLQKKKKTTVVESLDNLYCQCNTQQQQATILVRKTNALISTGERNSNFLSEKMGC